MAENLHGSSDVPNFDTYPAQPPAPERALPSGDSALEKGARQVGATIGKAVYILRKGQQNVKETADDVTSRASARVVDIKSKAQQSIGDLADAAKNTAQRWTSTAATRAGELRQATAAKVSEVGSQIKIGYYRTRMRANRVVREYPLHVVLVAGGIGFLMGVGLRIWRASREY